MTTISNPIYQPRGAAAEYSPLAVNLFRGCVHACRYCYAPACLRRKADEFHAAATVRPGVLDALDRQAARMAGDDRRILLCFTCDPYPPIDRELAVTRQAIGTLARYRLAVSVLTKNGADSPRDFDLLAAAGGQFGVSVVWGDDRRRAEWEPGASSISTRLTALERARRLGISTWASVEPVVEPNEGLAAIRSLIGLADVIKIGKLNHDAARERTVDWTEFLRETLGILKAAKQRYVVKNELWKWADANMRSRHSQAT